MEGKRNFSIGEISEILNIPASTLRFWEEKGLFHIPKKENNYRSYSSMDLVQIAEIMFYRNLGMPVKRINDFLTAPLEEHEAFLHAVQQQLVDKIEEYQRMYQQICLQQAHFQTLIRLLEKPYTLEEIPFFYVAAWDFWEKDKLRRYIHDPACYVWLRDTSSPDPGQKGIILDQPPAQGEAPLLWVKMDRRMFLTFPVHAEAEDNYEGVEARDLIACAQEHCHTGLYMAQHLLTCNGKEYLKGYLEIRETPEKMEELCALLREEMEKEK